MELNTLLNANASNIAVTTTATLLTALLDTAAGGSNVFRPHLDAVDIYVEDGDVRILYDGNVPTASKGMLLKRGGLYRLRRTPISMLRLISATGSNVSVSIQVGRSEAQEPSSVGFAPFLLEQFAGEDIAGDRLMVEQRNSYAYINSATTTQVKTGSGLLHSITVQGGTTGTIIIYDETSGTSVIIASFDTTVALATYTFNVAFTTGLKIVTSAATKLTVSYR